MAARYRGERYVNWVWSIVFIIVGIHGYSQAAEGEWRVGGRS